MLSDFVSTLSMAFLQETYNTAKYDSQSSPSPDNLESEQTDPFLDQSELHATNNGNFTVGKTIPSVHSSETKDKRDCNVY